MTKMGQRAARAARRFLIACQFVKEIDWLAKTFICCSSRQCQHHGSLNYVALLGRVMTRSAANG
jgi:hypothetical protein